MLEIVHAHEGAFFSAVPRLFREYADSLDVSLDFQNFEDELLGLPGDYAPPRGRLLIALKDDTPAGCAAFRKFSDTISEMKRLYIKPECRGFGIGRALVDSLIVDARRAGYERMRLDTLPSMKTATALYTSLGFYRIPPYRHNPVKGAAFMELVL